MDRGANPPLADPSFTGSMHEPHRLAGPGRVDLQGEGNFIGVTQLANIIRRHRLLLALIVGGSLALAAISLANETSIYEATATLRMDTPIAPDGSDRALNSAEAETRVETETRTLASHEFATEVVRDLELLDHPAFTGRKASQGRTRNAGKKRIDRAATRLMSIVQVQRVPHTQLINVTVESPSPRFAALVANSYVEVRQKGGVREKLLQQDQIVAALDERTRRAGEELRRAEQMVADYRRENGMLVGAGSGDDLATINKLAAEAASAASLRAAAAAKAAGVEVAASMRPGPDGATSPLLAQQQQRYDQLLQRKAELSAFYGAGYPSLAKVNAEIEEVRRNMDAEKARVQQNAIAAAAADANRETGLARSEAAGAAARSAVLNRYLGDTTSKAYQNTMAGVRLAELERNVETKRTLYLALAGRVNQVSTGLVTGPGLVMHSAAPIPRFPLRPTPRKTLMVVLLAATILAFACAFVLELIDRRIRSPSQIQRLFQLETFATVPLLWAGLTKRAAGELIRTRPSSTYAESVRTLLREVTGLRRGLDAQVVLITSPLQGDGKTSVAHGLGAAAVAAGLRAVLVDLDLRKSRTVGAGEGVVDLEACLQEQAPVHGLLEHARDSADTSLLVIAPHEVTRDPSGVLSSNQLVSFFENLRSRVDLVIIDAPPVLAVRDASHMTSLADTTLLVVRWGRTRVEEMADTLSALKGGVNGVVLNAVDFARHAQGRYGDFVQYFSRSRAYYRADDDLLRPPFLARLFRNLRTSA